MPISIVEKPGAEPAELADGAALWTKPRSEIKPEEYTDFYRNFGAFDEPALTVHFRAEGRHEFTALAFVPSARPFDLYDAERKSRMKLYVKRVFITDDAEILPHYLRFVRGLVDSADLPLSLSREMIQNSPILAAIKKSVTGRVLGDLEKLADSDAEAYGKIWDVFGAVIKEGIYEDYERRDTLLKLARFRTTASAEPRRSLKDYVAALQAQPGRDLLHRRRRPRPDRNLAAPRRLPRPRHRSPAALRHGRQPVDQRRAVVRRQEVPFGDAGRGRIWPRSRCSTPRTEAKPEASEAVTGFIAFVKTTLGDAVSDVRASDRLTDSAVCLVASEQGPDRSLEKLLHGSGRVVSAHQAHSGNQSAPQPRHGAGRAGRRRELLQGGRRAPAVRRGARARRRAAERRQELLRPPGAADHARIGEELKLHCFGPKHKRRLHRATSPRLRGEVKGAAARSNSTKLRKQRAPAKFHRPNSAADLQPLNPNPRMIAAYVSGVRVGMSATNSGPFARSSVACVARSLAPSL